MGAAKNMDPAMMQQAMAQMQNMSNNDWCVAAAAARPPPPLRVRLPGHPSAGTQLGCIQTQRQQQPVQHHMMAHSMCAWRRPPCVARGRCEAAIACVACARERRPGAAAAFVGRQGGRGQGVKLQGQGMTLRGRDHLRGALVRRRDNAKRQMESMDPATVAREASNMGASMGSRSSAQQQYVISVSCLAHGPAVARTAGS